MVQIRRKEPTRYRQSATAWPFQGLAQAPSIFLRGDPLPERAHHPSLMLPVELAKLLRGSRIELDSPHALIQIELALQLLQRDPGLGLLPAPTSPASGDGAEE